MSRAVTEEEMTQGISRLEAHTAQIMEEAKARGIAVGVVDRTGRILYEKDFVTDAIPKIVSRLMGSFFSSSR